MHEQATVSNLQLHRNLLISTPHTGTRSPNGLRLVERNGLLHHPVCRSPECSMTLAVAPIDGLRVTTRQRVRGRTNASRRTGAPNVTPPGPAGGGCCGVMSISSDFSATERSASGLPDGRGHLRAAGTSAAPVTRRRDPGRYLRSYACLAFMRSGRSRQ